MINTQCRFGQIHHRSGHPLVMNKSSAARLVQELKGSGSFLHTVGSLHNSLGCGTLRWTMTGHVSALLAKRSAHVTQMGA